MWILRYESKLSRQSEIKSGFTRACRSRADKRPREEKLHSPIRTNGGGEAKARAPKGLAIFVGIQQIIFAVIHKDGATHGQRRCAVREANDFGRGFLFGHDSPARVAKDFALAITAHPIDATVAELFVADQRFTCDLSVEAQSHGPIGEKRVFTRHIGREGHPLAL